MKILGTGSFAPNCRVTNQDLEKIVETSDEWIMERTGIGNRHISDGQNTSEIAGIAAKKAIEASGIDPLDIDMILLATMSPDGILPNVACKVQAITGAKNATCFDINAACSGFIFALNTANAYLVSGMAKRILVIGAETLSKYVDYGDRSTCILFGDGAGAMVVEADDKKYISVTSSDGVKGSVLTAGTHPFTNLIIASNDNSDKNYDINESDTNLNKNIEDEYIRMDGKEVFKFAVTKVPKAISEVIEKSGVTKEDIDLFVLHQANTRILESVAKRLNIDQEKIPSNLYEYGNTSAASIPLLIDELYNEGKIHEGMKIVLSGFGGGLTYGASYMEV